MKPAPPETAELLHRVRQQLLLAQVRIMELEDTRDELAPKLAVAEKLLASAQTLADQKSEEAGHLDQTLSALQAQFEHLRHMQHLTNEALNETRRQLAETGGRLATAEQTGGQLRAEILSLKDQAARLDTALAQTAHARNETAATAAARLDRILQLDLEARAMKSSRSWRWTAWLRAVERAWAGRKS